MALANVAYILATHASFGRKKVLMIDWDLEAPGLYRFFQNCFAGKLGLNPKRSSYVERLTQAPGLMEYIERAATTYKNSTLSGSLDEAHAHLPQAAEIYRDVRHKKPDDFDSLILPVDDCPNLLLLKAGSENDDYSDRVRLFNWEDFYSQSGSFFTHFREHLMEDYDYILIDSRTGLTDTSGICTRVMPEKMVGVFAPNFQNLEGLTGVIRRSTEYRREARDPRALVVFPLASRIAAGAEKLRKIWWHGGEIGDAQSFEGYQALFQDLFVEMYELDYCDLGGYFDATQIPHDNDYAFGEKVAARLDVRTADKLSIGTACTNLTERLVRLDAPWEPLPEQARLTEAQRQADEASRRVDKLQTKSEWSRRFAVAMLVITVLAVLSSLSPVRSFLSRLILRQNNQNSQNVPVNNAGSPVPGSSPSVPLKISAVASSTKMPLGRENYDPRNAIDGNSETAWIEGVKGPGIGEWIRFDFDREVTLHRIVIRDDYRQKNRIAIVRIDFSDGSGFAAAIFDDSGDRIDTPAVRVKWVRIAIGKVYPGGDPGPEDDTAISEVAFEWEP